jgi:predicted RND superfamily exporter protein
LMIVVFRSVNLGMLAMLPNLLPLLFGAALLVLIGQTLDMGAVIAFSFCLGIAVDDTVHFMANYARMTREGKSPREAVANIFTHTVPALLTTTIILVVAFGAFIFASFLPNRNFGLFVAVILSMALIADLTLLPALLMKKKADEPAKQGV